MSLAGHDIKEIEKRMRASIDALKRDKGANVYALGPPSAISDQTLTNAGSVIRASPKNTARVFRTNVSLRPTCAMA